MPGESVGGHCAGIKGSLRRVLTRSVLVRLSPLPPVAGWCALRSACGLRARP